MKPLIVLILVFVVSLFIVKVLRGEYLFHLPARIAMAAMLLFSAIGHFAFTKGMTMMLPPAVPCKNFVVYLTGIVEILFAVCILIPGYSRWTGWLLIAFLILILPANIYASLKHVNYRNASLDGSGVSYLWFRIPLQLFFIAWIYLSCIRY